MSTADLSAVRKDKNMNSSANGSLTFDPYGPAPGPLGVITWSDCLWFVLVSFNGCIGSILNGFLLWVLAWAPNQGLLDIIQMNKAATDLIEGILGVALMISARIMVAKNVFVGTLLFHIDHTLVMIGIAIEDMTTIFLSVYRTKQV